VSPLAIPDLAVTTIGRAVTIDVGANDIGFANRISLDSPAASGTVTQTGPETFVYQPDPGLTGVDTFTYSRCNLAARLCTSAAVTVTVVPAVQDDEATTFEGQPVDIAILANDLGATSPPVIASPPANGTAVIVGLLARYTPAPGFVGVDTFTYDLCAPELARAACATATVTVTVLPTPNQPPVLTPLALTTPQDTPVSGQVGATDPEGQTVTFASTPVSGPANGTATVAPDGTVSYTPAPGFVGVDAFTVQACDSAEPPACATTEVTVTVTPEPPPTVPPTTVPPPTPPPTPPPPTPSPPIIQTTLPSEVGPASTTPRGGSLPASGAVISGLLLLGVTLVAGGLVGLAARRRGGLE
jgi:hypothetical protein